MPTVPSRGENLHSVYVLLFLNIAFFFLEHQDVERYAALFRFDWTAVLNGEIWRLFTYQFTQAGQGWFFFPKPLVLFFTLLLLYFMGSALEEEWGTRRFVILFALSTLTSAATGAYLAVPLLGSYFVNFTLLFVYAANFPQQTFYLFGVLPIRVRWIAWMAAAVLLAGVFAGGAANTAALSGAVAAFVYYAALRVHAIRAESAASPAPEPDAQAEASAKSIRNAARFVAISKAVASASVADIDRLTGQLQRETLEGVNICPPADYKPASNDGYCIRCEGFAECSARYLTMNRPRVSVGDPSPVPERSR